MSVNNSNNRLSLLYKHALYLGENAVNEDKNGNVVAAVKSFSEVSKVYRIIFPTCIISRINLKM